MRDQGRAWGRKGEGKKMEWGQEESGHGLAKAGEASP